MFLGAPLGEAERVTTALTVSVAEFVE